jgi:hypothetical protein
MDGPYNEHLVRDVGALNLSLFLLSVGALFVGSRAIAKLAALAWLAYAIPHLVYHQRHLPHGIAGFEQAVFIGSLAVLVLAPVVILLPWPRRASADLDRVAPAPVRTVGA